MTNSTSPDQYMGRDVVDPQGNKIGSVGQVYLDDQTGQPDWITVNTGLFGLRENFVPLQGASFDGDDLRVPFDKDTIKDAPTIDDASHLDDDEQDRLYDYYQRYMTGTGGTSTTTTTVADTVTGADATGTADYRSETETSRGTVGYDTSGPTTDDAMTRSEERLNVGTERTEAGRARLRKYVVTEQQTVNVPVSREEVRLEREPITDANIGDATSGPDISEEEHEVVLTEERPVVTTEAVPVERVRLEKETVTDTQAVSGELRKEEIEVEGAGERLTGETGTTYSDRRDV